MAEVVNEGPPLPPLPPVDEVTNDATAEEAAAPIDDASPVVVHEEEHVDDVDDEDDTDDDADDDTNDSSE